jgi:hypothetical protein
MKRLLFRSVLPALCATALLAANPQQGDAGLIPWVYNAIFGTGPMYAGYGPTYASYGYAPSPWSASYASYGYTPTYAYASYAPLAYDPVACCAPACDPCCPTACGPCSACPGGACAYDAAPVGGTLTPQPDGSMGPPRTYIEEPPAGTSPSVPPADPGFRRRAPQEEQNEDVFGDPGTTPPQADSFGASEQSDLFKVPESVIEQRRPAPAGGPSVEETETETLRVPPLGLDDKITWRAAPERTRLAVAANYATPVVARTKIDPNSGWTPVAAGTQLAKN